MFQIKSNANTKHALNLHPNTSRCGLQDWNMSILQEVHVQICFRTSTIPVYEKLYALMEHHNAYVDSNEEGMSLTNGP